MSTTQTKLFKASATSSVGGQDKVDVIHRQPMKTIGWHYAKYVTLVYNTGKVIL